MTIELMEDDAHDIAKICGLAAGITNERMMTMKDPYIKRRRGRPRKQPDPHQLPTACCANCARSECTSGLSDRIRRSCTDRACVNHEFPKDWSKL